jgi:hypothetical protein
MTPTRLLQPIVDGQPSDCRTGARSRGRLVGLRSPVPTGAAGTAGVSVTELRLKESDPPPVPGPVGPVDRLPKPEIVSTAMHIQARFVNLCRSAIVALASGNAEGPTLRAC